jgi:hypothetical protein
MSKRAMKITGVIGLGAILWLIFPVVMEIGVGIFLLMFAWKL